MGAALSSPEGQAAAADVPKFATGGVTMFVAHDRPPLARCLGPPDGCARPGGVAGQIGGMQHVGEVEREPRQRPGVRVDVGLEVASGGLRWR
jgi:hypothetical protein